MMLDSSLSSNMPDFQEHFSKKIYIDFTFDKVISIKHLSNTFLKKSNAFLRSRKVVDSTFDHVISILIKKEDKDDHVKSLKSLVRI